jgi:hypothetical protein
MLCRIRRFRHAHRRLHGRRRAMNTDWVNSADGAGVRAFRTLKGWDSWTLERLTPLREHLRHDDPATTAFSNMSNMSCW